MPARTTSARTGGGSCPRKWSKPGKLPARRNPVIMRRTWFSSMGEVAGGPAAAAASAPLGAPPRAHAQGGRYRLLSRPQPNQELRKAPLGLAHGDARLQQLHHAADQRLLERCARGASRAPAAKDVPSELLERGPGVIEEPLQVGLVQGVRTAQCADGREGGDGHGTA